MFVADHGQVQGGGHGGDSVIERTSVIGTNQPDTMNAFFSTPSNPILLTDNDEQNKLMGYPGITSIAPTVIEYLGYEPKVSDYFSSPSLINTLGAYKVFVTQTYTEDRSKTTVNLTWQQGKKVKEMSIYRNGVFVTKLTNNEVSFTEELTAAEQGEGYQTIFYTIKADVGSAVASSVEVYLGQPAVLAEVIAKATTTDTFNSTTGQFNWVMGTNNAATYGDGPFSDTPSVKSVNVNSENGHLSLAKDYTGVNETSLAFWLKVNGDFHKDPSIISNKDWDKGYYKGFILVPDGDQMKINVGDGDHRVDSSKLNMVKNEWMYVVMTFNLTTDRLSFYVKDSTNNYQLSESGLSPITSLASDFPLNISETGDGKYNKTMALKLDINIADLLMFDTALSPVEARALMDQTAPLTK